MKKIYLALLAILVCAALNAQEETLLGSDLSSGIYGAPVFKTGLFNGHPGYISGGRGAWIINHKFAIGGGDYSMYNDLRSAYLSQNEKPLYYDLTYGGFEMEYISNSDKFIHGTVRVLLGKGTLKLVEHNPEITMKTDRLKIVEPSLNLEMNICSWLRINAGVSYRLFMNLELDEISYRDINGPSGQIAFKFGGF